MSISERTQIQHQEQFTMVMTCGFQRESPPCHYIHTFKVHPLRGQRENGVPLHPILNVISEIFILCSHTNLFPGKWMLGIYILSNRNCSRLTVGAPKIIIPEEDSSTPGCSPRFRIVHASNTRVCVNSLTQLSSCQAKFISFLAQTPALGEDPCLHFFPEVPGLKLEDPVFY